MTLSGKQWMVLIFFRKGELTIAKSTPTQGINPHDIWHGCLTSVTKTPK